jgi:hypothetical protein
MVGHLAFVERREKGLQVRLGGVEPQDFFGAPQRALGGKDDALDLRG